MNATIVLGYQKAESPLLGRFRRAEPYGEHRLIRGALTTPLNMFRQHVFDDLHGVYRMKRQLTGKLESAVAYETARLTRGAVALVELPSH